MMQMERQYTLYMHLNPKMDFEFYEAIANKNNFNAWTFISTTYLGEFEIKMDYYQLFARMERTPKNRITYSLKSRRNIVLNLRAQHFWEYETSAHLDGLENGERKVGWPHVHRPRDVEVHQGPLPSHCGASCEEGSHLGFLEITQEALRPTSELPSWSEGFSMPCGVLCEWLPLYALCLHRVHDCTSLGSRSLVALQAQPAVLAWVALASSHSSHPNQCNIFLWGTCV